MVGETSILSAAGLRLLENTPGVSFAEGCFGSFLLTDDVADRPLRFRYGGRLPRIGPTGLGCAARPERLERLCLGRPIAIEL
jgi:L-Ala-D/L-Glu epimerase